MLDLCLTANKSGVVAATVLAALLLKFCKVALDALDYVHLNLAVKLGGLRRPLGRDHERAHHIVNLFCLVVLLVLAHIESLVHEVSQVGDRGDLVAIEAIDDYLVDEAT